MKIELSSKFRKAYRKFAAKRPEVAVIALEKILLFSQQPNNPISKFHIIVDLINPHEAAFTMIGSHDEVY